jgi:moderate conductance mechanosensitive channel
VLVLAASADQAELINVCGPDGQRAWLCERVHDLTGSATAARVADDLAKPVRILVIVVVAYLVTRIAKFLVRRVVKRLATDDTTDQIARMRRATGVALLDTSPTPNVRRALRAETIGAVLRSVIAIVVWATAGLMILETLSINLAAIGIGVSIIGVAVGFGSQSLVKDFVTGTFMVLEDQYGVGDVIDAGVASGTVEGVSLRTTRLRDAEGVVWHIPNGTIVRVGNKSQQWARCLLDIPVAYDSDLPTATAAILGAAQEVAADPDLAHLVIDDPEVLGVEQITNDQVVIRLGVKTRPLEQWKIARALRPRVKAALDAAGIKPLGDSVVTYRAEGPPR